MDDLAVYEKQKFGQPLGFGRRLALMVVDFVNGFVDPEIFGGGNIAEAVRATLPLLDEARRLNLPVVFTRIVYAEDGSDAGVWCMKAPRLRELTEAAPASRIVAELAPRAGELVIRKTQASAFFGTPLSGCLRAAGVDTLLVTGATTSGCVRATVIDAISHNFRPVVVTDCVGDRALEPHHANIFDMGQKYADLLSANEAIGRLAALQPESAG
jgi:maleamate amidohydrolase